MINKKRSITAKKSFIYIFSSFYIIGLIVSVMFMKDATLLTEGVKSGFDAIKESNPLYSVLLLSLSFFAVSLVLWSYCTLMSAFGFYAGALAVSVFLGYSSGISCCIMLKGFMTGGIWYVLFCIIPASVLRFFLWYWVANSPMITAGRNKKEKRIRPGLLLRLISILAADILVAVVTVVFGEVFL